VRDATNPTLIALSDERPRRRKSDRIDWRWIVAVLGALGVGGGGAQLINTPWLLKSEAAEQRAETRSALAEHEAREEKARGKLEEKVDEVKTDVKEILREMRGRRR
jgi:hypothetical protein